MEDINLNNPMETMGVYNDPLEGHMVNDLLNDNHDDSFNSGGV